MARLELYGLVHESIILVIILQNTFAYYLLSCQQYVDYAGISNSTDFKLYMDMTLELQRVDVESLSREEKLAFFINIYNALVIHINVSVSVPVNMYQRYKVHYLFSCDCVPYLGS